MRKTFKPYSIARPVHPTVAAEFVVRRSAVAGDPLPFAWVRGGVVGAGWASLGECEKSALAYLRSLPVRP
jgi:hypothetical protein